MRRLLILVDRSIYEKKEIEKWLLLQESEVDLIHDKNIISVQSKHGLNMQMKLQKNYLLLDYL